MKKFLVRFGIKPRVIIEAKTASQARLEYFLRYFVPAGYSPLVKVEEVKE